MYRLTVLYMNQPGATFNIDYYVKSHMPMVCRHIGKAATRFEVAEGLPGPGQAPSPVKATGTIYLTDLAPLTEAMQKHGAEILGDVKNYTNIHPTMVTEKLHT